MNDAWLAHPHHINSGVQSDVYDPSLTHQPPGDSGSEF